MSGAGSPTSRTTFTPRRRWHGNDACGQSPTAGAGCQTPPVRDFEAFEAAGWEERAHAYHRFFTPVTGQVAGALLHAARVAAGRRVLDVGSGPGVVAGTAAARGALVVGIDLAEEMVALARRSYPGVEFRRGDAHALPFPDGSFDAAVGNFVVLHLGRPEQAAAELLRVLVPGGRAALSAWDAPERGRLPGLFAEAVAAVGAPPPAGVPDGPPFFRFSDDAEFTALLTGAGFTDVSVATHSFVHRVPSPDGLWHGVLEGTVRTRATVLGQPEEVRTRVRAEFDRLVAPYADGDGYAVPVAVKVASGAKPA